MSSVGSSDRSGQFQQRQQLGAALLRDVLALSGRARFRAWGSSMLPVLWPGQVLEVVRVAEGELRIGDVILFERDRRLFCHRIRRMSAGEEGALRLCTRGDFLAGDDPWISSSAVLGRVCVPAGRDRRLWAFFLRTLSAVSQRPIAWMLRRSASTVR